MVVIKRTSKLWSSGIEASAVRPQANSRVRYIVEALTPRVGIPTILQVFDRVALKHLIQVAPLKSDMLDLFFAELAGAITYRETSFR